MTRIVWWIERQALRFDRHPIPAFITCFAFLWIVSVLSLHLVDKSPDGAQGTLPWGNAVPNGLLLALFCTSAVFFIGWRRR
jgi:cytochrome c oxidase subunit IV